MKKDKLIEEYLAKPILKGEDVLVKGFGSQNKQRWGITKVVEVLNDGAISVKNHSVERVEKENWKKWLGEVGADPFPKRRDRIENLNFTLDSVLFTLGLGKEPKEEDRYEVKGIPVKNCNFNPFVYVNGKKEYYQRPLVWELEDKQLLLESIYNNIDCGKILVRRRGWKELELLVEKGETKLFWYDVVDGKQRLNAIDEFVKDGFPDNFGNYHSDLSEQAQRRLLNHQLFSYSQLPEDSMDEDVLEQFLKLNFCGIPQSKEHIEFVKSLTK